MIPNKSNKKAIKKLTKQKLVDGQNIEIDDAPNNQPNTIAPNSIINSKITQSSGAVINPNSSSKE